MPQDDDDFDVEVDEDEEQNDGAEGGDDEDGGEGKPKPNERDSRAVRAAKAARRERDAARRELAELRAKSTAKDDAPDDAARDRAADERAFTRYRPKLVAASASAALVSAGAKPDRVRRLVKLLDVDEVEVDESGEVDEDSLAVEVDRLKEEWPELFATEEDKPKAPRRRVDGGTVGAGKPGGSTKRSSSTAALAKALTGQRR